MVDVAHALEREKKRPVLARMHTVAPKESKLSLASHPYCRAMYFQISTGAPGNREPGIHAGMSGEQMLRDVGTT
jgi:hypothetical protein